MTVVDVDLDVDSNNNESITDADDPVEEGSPGKMIQVNIDNDDGDDDNDDGIIDDDDNDYDDEFWDGDVADTAELILRLAPNELPAVHTIELSVSDPLKIRIFDETNASIIGPTTVASPANPVSTWSKPLSDINLPANDLTFHVEGVDPGEVTVTLQYKTETGVVITSDTVKLMAINVQFLAPTTTILAGGVDNATDTLPIQIIMQPAAFFTEDAVEISLIDGGNGTDTDTITVAGTSHSAAVNPARLTGDINPSFYAGISSTPSALNLDSAGIANIILRSSNFVGDSTRIELQCSVKNWTSDYYQFSGSSITSIVYKDSSGNPVVPTPGGIYTMEFMTVFDGVPVEGHNVIGFVTSYTDTSGTTHPLNGGDLTEITQAEIDAMAAVLEVTPVSDKYTDNSGKVVYDFDFVGSGVEAFTVDYRDLFMIVEE